jgi:Mrp family chromosome partitioning ATPase
MSRNFQLMKQLTEEVNESQVHVPIAADRFLRMPDPFDGTDGISREETIQLVRRVFLSAGENAPRQVLFCGVEGDSASSVVCVQTARVLAAHSSLSVCLIDANLRSPRLDDFFRVDTTTPYTGTFESLRGQCGEVGANLWSAGPEILANDNRELLPPEDLKKRFAELRSMFGHVLIDAAATNVHGDVQLLGQLSDAAILVIEANRTRRQTARNAKEALDAAGVRLLGAVLHNRSFPIPEKLYKRL